MSVNFAYFCLAMIFSEGDIIRFIFDGTGISLKDEMFANSAGLLLSMSSFLLTSSSRIRKNNIYKMTEISLKINLSKCQNFI